MTDNSYMSSDPDLNKESELSTWKTRAEKSEDIVKWILTVLALNNLGPSQLMDDKYHIQGSIHILIDAYNSKTKYVETNARVYKENLKLIAERDTLKSLCEKLEEQESFRLRALESKKASVKKPCGHLQELVIDTETGERICCECWAQEAEARCEKLEEVVRKLINPKVEFRGCPTCAQGTINRHNWSDCPYLVAADLLAGLDELRKQREGKS